MGSIWLGTQEYQLMGTGNSEAWETAFTRATSSDTVRSRVYTGKPARLLKTKWTEAWAEEGAPAPLPMSLQNLLVSVAHNRIAALPACVAELTNLAELLLPHNRVERLLPAHHAPTSLAYLDVNHNPIRTPPMEVLSLILARKGAPHSPSSLSPDDLAAGTATKWVYAVLSAA